MSDHLTKDLIKLGHEEPSLRPHISRIIDKVSRSISEHETDILRYTITAREVNVWDLTNAGVRGAQVPYYSIFTADADPEDIQYLKILLDGIKRPQEIDSVLQDFIDTLPPKSNRLSLSYENGIDVRPLSFSQIEIRNRGVAIKAGYDNFTIKDLTDLHNKPTAISLDSQKSSASKFYSWVEKNQDRIRKMSFHDILDALDNLRIQYHYYLATS